MGKQCKIFGGREEEIFGMRGKGGKSLLLIWGKNGNFFWGELVSRKGVKILIHPLSEGEKLATRAIMATF